MESLDIGESNCPESSSRNRLSRSTRLLSAKLGVGQRVGHLRWKQEIVGSNPTVQTSIKEKWPMGASGLENRKG